MATESLKNTMGSHVLLLKNLNQQSMAKCVQFVWLMVLKLTSWIAMLCFEKTIYRNDTIYMTKARDAQTGILPGQEPDGVRIFLYKKRPVSQSVSFLLAFPRPLPTPSNELCRL